MTRNQLKQIEKDKKHALKIEKRDARRLKRKEKRALKKEVRAKERFIRNSEARYKLSHRIGVKALRVGGPVLGIAYVVWKLVGTFQLETEVQVGALDLNLAIILMFFLVVVGIAGIWYLTRYIKRAKTAIDVASNMGKPSFKFSPLSIDAARAVMGAWFFGLMWLFNYIGLHYGESLNAGMTHLLIGYAIAFGSVIVADVFEQTILTRISTQEHDAEAEAREMTQALYEKMQEQIVPEVIED